MPKNGKNPGPGRVVALGASAGGIEALTRVVAGLPRDLPSAVAVVLHLAPHAASGLPLILARAGPLAAAHARDGEPLVPGRILVAPPDRHLVLDDGYVRLLDGPRENNVRPAIDPLFRSGARVYGPRFVAAVLSGTLDDGSAGLLAVRRTGGLALVQDPADALYPEMPLNALEVAGADARAAADALGGLIARAVSEPVEVPTRRREVPRTTAAEGAKPGRPAGGASPFTCPACGGVLWEARGDGAFEYECRTGHVYAPRTLHASQREVVEGALWAAIRALEESAALARRLETRAAERTATQSARQFADQAEAYERQVQVLRALVKVPPAGLPAPGSAPPPRARSGGRAAAAPRRRAPRRTRRAS